MPQLLVPVFTGIGFGTVGATIAAYATYTAVSYLALKALAPKPPSLGGERGTVINAREATAPQEYVYGTMRKGGTVFFMEGEGSENRFLHICIALAGHPVDQVGAIYVNDEIVTIDGNGLVGGKWKDKIRVRKFDGTQTTGNAELAAATSASADFIAQGIAYLYVRLEFDQDVFAGGIPTFTAVVRGKKVFDPRTATTAWSDNTALCIRDYIMDERGLNDPEVDDVQFAVAANDCDAEGYKINGVVYSDQGVGSNLSDMVLACSGSIPIAGGFYGLRAGVYAPSVASFTLDDMRSEIDIQTRHSLRDNFNEVIGTFPNADDDWIRTDYPAVTEAAFLAQDANIENQLDLPFSMVTNGNQARQIAKQVLFRSREQITVSADFGMKAVGVEIGDVVDLTIEANGWTSKEFEVVSWEMKIADTGGVRIAMVLRETSEAAFDAVSPATIISNDTNLPDPFVGLGVSNLVASAGGRTQGDGTFVSSVILSWTGANSSFVSFYDVEWKPLADSAYSSTTSSATSIEVGPIVDGIEYVARVRAVSINGIRGEWATVQFQGGGDTTAPGPVTALSAIGAYQVITLSYTPPADADWSRVNVYEGATNVFGSAALIGSSVTDKFYRMNLPNNVERFYWVETEDFSGNKGTVVGPVSATTQLLEEVDFGQSVQDALDRAGLQSVNTLPATGDFDNQIVFLLSDFTMYRWDATSQAWSDTLYTAIENDSVTTDKIRANAIVGSKILAGAVTADKIAVNQLSAISANIGTFTSALTGARMVIQDDKIIVYDASNVVRVKIGNLA